VHAEGADRAFRHAFLEPQQRVQLPGPSVGGAITSNSFAHGHVATGQLASVCPATSRLIDLGVAGRDLVQRWVNGDQVNHGLSLRASATDSGVWKKFAGAVMANPPKLFITHHLAYRACRADTGAPAGEQRAAGLTATVARGASVTLDATIQPMPPGWYFLDFTMVRTGGVVFTDHQVPPGRIVLQVFDIPPVAEELHPPNGYQNPTPNSAAVGEGAGRRRPSGIDAAVQVLGLSTRPGGQTGVLLRLRVPHDHGVGGAGRETRVEQGECASLQRLRSVLVRWRQAKTFARLNGSTL
jgi:hypothetical protein